MNPPKKNLNLAKVLKVGYKNEKTQNKVLGKYGYQMDKPLSNDNQQVYYNPKDKKLLVNITGTHNTRDVGTDAYLALGNLKGTNRYKEADKVLQQAKAKYDEDIVVLSGHSLGGSIAQGIGKPTDKVYTLNSGYTIGQKTKSTQNNYRTSGDAVSLLGAGSNNLKTVGKEPTLFQSFAKGGLIGLAKNALASHTPKTIKGENIFV